MHNTFICGCGLHFGPSTANVFGLNHNCHAKLIAELPLIYLGHGDSIRYCNTDTVQYMMTSTSWHRSIFRFPGSLCVCVCVEVVREGGMKKRPMDYHLQRQLKPGFDIFFIISMKKLLDKHPSCRWHVVPYIPLVFEQDGWKSLPCLPSGLCG